MLIWSNMPANAGIPAQPSPLVSPVLQTLGPSLLLSSSLLPLHPSCNNLLLSSNREVGSRP